MANPHIEREAEKRAILGAQAGRTEDFGTLFKLHYEQAYRTIYGMMGNEADAQDIAQQAWLKAWQKIDRFNFQSSFATWLHRIAVNTSLDELRRRKRSWARFKSMLKPDGSSAIEHLPEAASNESPDRGLLRKENASIIHQAIARLPEKQRTVLVLKEFEDYTYQEIADTLDCKIGTVMSRLHLARTKLHALLNKS